jgi:protein-S-isoprenylcysteine O-methyltransferase Ste14
MTVMIAKLIWAIGCAAACLIRFVHQRRFRKTLMVRSDRTYERISIAIALCGLFVIPLIYATTGQPAFASYEFRPSLVYCGAAVFAAALLLLYCAHRDLGHFWSAKLRIRNDHALVTHGVYSRLRHPMYAAFWLWALAQALLLPNLVAGPAGLIGFGALFILRVGREEELMLDAFGDNYRSYIARTKRIIPGVY